MKRQQKRRSSTPKSNFSRSDSTRDGARPKSAPKGKRTRGKSDGRSQEDDRSWRGKSSRSRDGESRYQEDRPRRGKPRTSSRDRYRGNDDSPRRRQERSRYSDSREFERRDGDRRNFDSSNSSPQAGVPNEQNRDDLIFGRHTVIAAMEHGRTLNKIWVLSQLRRNNKINELLMACKAKGTVIDEVNTMRLDQLTAHGTHQGLVAQVGACEYLDFDDLITQAKAKTDSPVIIAIDGITDPHNLGAIIRSAEALGTQGLVLPQRRAASVGATVAKVAAGALESLPISRVVNLNQALESLKEEGFWIYGLTLDADVYMNQVDLNGPVVLLIGSEGKGLSKVTQKHCDQTVKIPLAGETQSLNASVATGVGIYEIFRQRISAMA